MRRDPPPIRPRRTRAHSHGRRSRLKYRRPKTSFMKRRSDMNRRPENVFPFDRLHSNVRVCYVTTNVVVHGRFPCRLERKVRKVICKNISIILIRREHTLTRKPKKLLFSNVYSDKVSNSRYVWCTINRPCVGSVFFSLITNYISFRLWVKLKLKQIFFSKTRNTMNKYETHVYVKKKKMYIFSIYIQL